MSDDVFTALSENKMAFWEVGKIPSIYLRDNGGGSFLIEIELPKVQIRDINTLEDIFERHGVLEAEEFKKVIKVAREVNPELRTYFSKFLIHVAKGEVAAGYYPISDLPATIDYTLAPEHAEKLACFLNELKERKFDATFVISNRGHVQVKAWSIGVLLELRSNLAKAKYSNHRDACNFNVVLELLREKCGVEVEVVKTPEE